METDANLWREKLVAFHGELYGNGRSDSPTKIEVIDRATDDTVKRLGGVAGDQQTSLDTLLTGRSRSRSAAKNKRFHRCLALLANTTHHEREHNLYNQ